MFLVGTNEALLYVREDGVTTPIDSGKGSYTGVEKFFGKYYISTNNDDSQVNSDILVLDKRLRMDSIEEPENFCMDRIYDVKFWRGRLICTAGDFIAVFDGENWERWQPLKQSFSSMAIMNDRLFVLANNSFVLEFDGVGEPTKNIHANIGVSCYNLIAYDDDIYTLCTKEGTIRTTSGFVRDLGETDLRGLTFANDNFWIGTSRGAIIQYDNDFDKISEIELDYKNINCITAIGAKASNPQLRMLS